MTTDPSVRLRAALARFVDLPESEWLHFASRLRECRFAPRDHLIREGAFADDVHFIVSGLVRIYHSDDGRELVRGFDYEDRFVASYDSLLSQAPASINAQALEPTHTLSFRGSFLASLYDRHPAWDRLGRRLLEEQWIRSADKERRFRIHGAEEHYRLLIARGSPLVDRVPLNQLASYLRVTPETLSRIRARIREQIRAT